MFWRTREGIYGYHDGRRRKYADPLDLWTGLFDTPEIDIEAIDKDTSSDSPLTDKEKNTLVIQATNHIAKVFGLHLVDPRTGKGVTRAEAYAQFVHFMYWMAEVKKKQNALPKRSSSSDPASATATTNKYACF